MADRPDDMHRELEAILYDFDVFIIFASEDEELAKYVCDGLEELNLRCNAQFKQNAFQTGQNVFDNVVHNVKNANRTLLLLSEKSLKSQWVTLETILALEESQRCNSLRLRMLLDSHVRERDVKMFKRGILASVPHIRLDFNREGWNKVLADEICSKSSVFFLYCLKLESLKIYTCW